MEDNLYYKRLEAVRALMRSNGWDILVITGGDPHASECPAQRWQQVQWLSGFTGEAGDLVITATHAGLWTDTRYFIQAVRQLRGTGIELHKMRVPDQVPIPQWIASLQMDSPVIAFDALCLSVDTVRELIDAVPSCTVAPVPDLLSPLWHGRPAVPSTPVITLGEDLVGESRESKLSRLRKWLVLNGADSIVLSSLDQIAWLLNVRGQDIEYNPYVISYLLVTLDGAFWFVRKDAYEDPDPETAASFEELEADGITIEDYSDIEYAMSALRTDYGADKVCIDTSSLSHILREAIDDGDLLPEVFETESPIPLWKAVKNSTEIDGMREAHLEDGLVMEQFLYWLSQNAGAVTEWDAACELVRLHTAVPGYRGESFPTISAYGEGAALPHYATPQADAPLLERHGLYLVDSGGQYLFGTTDVTRTVPLGPCSPLEVEDYTLVLRGNIQLAMAIFPAGTAGCQIDALAREPLWRARRNFGHGTGHGVGFFLSVHEGPQDIRQNFNPQPLLPGMVVSDEPGIYREGMHGVRHENLLLVRQAGDNNFGSWLGFETLTLCHFDTSCLDVSLMGADEIAWLNAYNARVFELLSPRLPSHVADWLFEQTRPV